MKNTTKRVHSPYIHPQTLLLNPLLLSSHHQSQRRNTSTNNNNNDNTYKILAFLSLSVMAATLISIFFMRERIVNAIVDATWKKIFERRDEYLTKCYPDRIIILRHGESHSNVEESILSDIPDHQIPLTENGISQAILAGKKIKAICGDDPIYCYYSPYERAKQTLDNVMIGGHLDLQVFTKLEDPRLIEQKFGNKQSCENMKLEKNMRLEYSRYFYQFKYGESGLDVNLRATAFVDRLFDHFRTGYYASKPDVHWNVLIVSHGLFMRVFLKAFLRCTINEFSTWYNYANCEMCVLIKQKDGNYKVCATTPLPITPRYREHMND